MSLNFTHIEILKNDLHKYFVKLLMFVILLFTGITVNAQVGIHMDVELPRHPRLLLFEGEEAGIRKLIKSDQTWQKVDRTIVAWADTILGKSPVERIKTGKRLLGPARECLYRVNYLSYSYRMTGEQKYFKRAEQEMLAAASFSDWNPSHFLDVAEFTMALSIGYDWLYNELSQDSRQIIRDAIVKKGLEPSLLKQHNGWLSGHSNWNQVCNAGMTYGALAVYEDEPELAAKIINRAIETISLPMKAYDPDGAYPEGYGYWGYGTTFNIMFLSAVEKIFKSDFGLLENKGFMKTAAFINNMVGATGQAFNYSDNSSAVGLYPAMFWFAGRLKDKSLLWNEKKLIEKETISNNKLLPQLLIWSKGIDLGKIQEPKEKMWVGNGENPVALMRTSWTDPNAIYVGVKGGTAMASHSHLDIGSFVMESDGVRWAMDFGAQSYYSLESKGIDLWNGNQDSQRWQVFRYNNRAHNTLTINNQFQLVKGYAPLTGYSSDKNFMNATFDLTEIYQDQLLQAKRGIAIVDQQYVVVRDELINQDKESTVRWTMLTSAEVNITGNNTAELTKDGKKLIMKVQGSATIKMETWPTAPTNDYDAPNPGTILVGFEFSLPPGNKQQLTVFLIPEKAVNKIDTNVKPIDQWN